MEAGEPGRWRVRLLVALGVSVMLNLLTLAAVVAASVFYAARLESMDTTFRRCSVGIRWTERQWDRGNVIALPADELELLRKELERIDKDESLDQSPRPGERR